MTDSEKSEAIHGAYRFLMNYDDERPNGSRYSNFAEAAYLAIRLHRHRIKEDPALRRVIRQKWIYAITDHFNNGEAEHQEMVALAYSLSPSCVTARLLEEIKIENKGDGFGHALRAYEQCWCRELSKSICSLSSDSSLTPRTARSLLQFLALHDRVIAVRHLKLFFKAQVKPLKLTPLTQAMVTAALFSLPEEFGDNLLSLLSRAPNSQLQQLLLESAFDLSYGRARGINALNDYQLSALYSLVFKLFPPETDPHIRHGEVKDVTARDKMRDIREGCLNVLVSRGTDSALAELEKLMRNTKAENRLNLQ